ncbi:ArnT family glycosyltransferase [uncultured Bradyrhizobium sp.]|uniref:ArnT family glycosyltransferase n=1 Tax=uncultured Bradyrhizobium sp. TaxID=199684 RepID=UPI0035CC84CC
MSLTPHIAAGRRDWSETTLWLLAAALLCFNLFVLLHGLNNGINDLFGFRQTQTALTAYWLIKEPHAFAYITPALGAPWSVPFEYPIYQWLVVFLTKAGAPLIVAGRLIAFSAYVGCLLPLTMMARDLQIPRRAVLVVSIVYFACPFYTYWSRTFMIETTALLFSLCWLAGFIRGRTNPTPLQWIATLGCGCLAVLTKSTTFLSIGPIAGAVYLFDAWIGLRGDRSAISGYRLFKQGLLCLFPLLIGAAWVAVSDHLKAANAYGLQLSSGALTAWNFGTLAQRFALKDTISRSLKETFGYIGFVLPVLMVLCFIGSRYRTAILFAVAGYLSAFLVFTNLHIVHTYYQSSNAIFACVAAGLAVASLSDKGWSKTALAVLFCIVASQLHYFHEFYWNAVANDNINSPPVLIALAAKEATKPEESLLVIGGDWSSVIPFYSERKSLMLPRFTPRPTFEKILADPQSFLDGARLGGIIDCRPAQEQKYRPEQTARIDQFMVGRKVIFQNQYCSLVVP